MTKIITKTLTSIFLFSIINTANALQTELLSRYESGTWGVSATEIVDYDANSQRIFVVNADLGAVDVLDFSDPNKMQRIATYKVGAINSLSIKNNMIYTAVADSAKKTNLGNMIVLDMAGNNIKSVEVGSLPDMITTTHDGKYAIIANEGEPEDDYLVNPEGTISIINLDDYTVRTVGFSDVKPADLDESILINGPAGTTVAQSFEPEYIAISNDDKFAYVSLQENNAIAVIDIANASLVRVFGLGYQDMSQGLFDVSDKDSGINLKSWPVKGLRQPDTIYSFNQNGTNYIVTANEGDTKAYTAYSEEKRVSKIKLDETAFPDAATLQLDENLGRLNITTAKGDTDGDGDFDELYTYGGRSFSIFDEMGNLIFDSGDDFENIIAKLMPDNFNSQGYTSSFDTRSDNKGVEPEALAIGMIGDKRFAFIGLERQGGVMIYNITNPKAVKFDQYLSTANIAGTEKDKNIIDAAPEGIKFIHASQLNSVKTGLQTRAKANLRQNAPENTAVILIANEVSGTVTAHNLTLKATQPESIPTSSLSTLSLLICSILLASLLISKKYIFRK